MDFLWPGLLVALALLPVLVGLYAWSLRRRRPAGVRYSSLSLLREAAPGSSRVRRHLPFALFVLAVGVLAFGAARPVLIASVPANQTSIILAIDVSGSMCSSDIAPSRLQAAEAAADQGIRIFTVGLGSPAGATVNLDGFQVHTQLNEPLLQQIADTTRGSYFRAEDSAQLHAIYANLDTRLTVEPQKIEVTSLFAGAGILLLAAGGVTSLLWLGRLP